MDGVDEAVRQTGLQNINNYCYLSIMLLFLSYFHIIIISIGDNNNIIFILN